MKLKKAPGVEPARRRDAAEFDELPGAYLEIGRTNQKRRTRDALVSVAADLIRQGRPAPVGVVADAAQISRTTAYRYFPTAELLAAQAALVVAGKLETEHLSAIASGGGSPAAKLDAIVTGSDALVRSNEDAFRAVLRLSLREPAVDDATKISRRPSIRQEWLQAALAEVKRQLGPRRFDRLVGALSLLCGVESVIVLHDICAMAPDEALEAKRWAAQQLLDGALAEARDKGAA
jgi:AcrR family transcriptional regulator